MSDIDELDEYNMTSSEGCTVRSDSDIEVAPMASGSDSGDRGTPTMWATFKGRNFIPSEGAARQLPPGQYTIDHSNEFGIYFNKRDINLDDLFVLPDSATETILAQIEDFWSKEDHFRKFGFLWKRGIMLWGPPGSGKTSALQLLSAQIINKGGISVYVNHPELAAQGLQLMRQIEPKRPLIVMIEDIDTVIHRYGESELLALLDGELQIDNVVFVATTNYPERLDKRIKNRPSRFDYVKKIGMPSPEARDLYLAHKNPRLDTDKQMREEWVELTRGFSIAHLKELIVSVEVFEIPLEEAISRLRKMMDVDITSDDNEDRRFGFTGDR